MSHRKRVVLADIRLTPAFSRVVTDEVTRKLLFYLQLVGEASTYQLAKHVFPQTLKEKYDTVRRRLLELEKWELIASKKLEGKEESGLPRRIYYRTFYEFFDIFWAEMEYIVGRKEAGKGYERREQEQLAQIMRNLFSHPNWVKSFTVMKEEYGLQGDRYPSSPYLMTEELPVIDPFDFSNFLSMLEETARRKFVGIDDHVRDLIERFLIAWGRGQYTLSDYVEFKPYLPSRMREYGIARGFVLPAASPSISRLITSPLDFAVLLYLHEARHGLEEISKEFEMAPERAERFCEECREAGLLEREVVLSAGGKETKIYSLPAPQKMLLDEELWRELEHSKFDGKLERRLRDQLDKVIDGLIPLWLGAIKRYRAKQKVTAPIPETLLRDLIYNNITDFYEHVSEDDLMKQAKKLGIPITPIYGKERE